MGTPKKRQRSVTQVTGSDSGTLQPVLELDGPLQVLLVTDDLFLRDVIRPALASRSLTLVGPTALSDASPTLSCPQVAIVDFARPFAEAVKRMRSALEPFPDLPILLLTDSDDDHTLQQGFVAGGRGFVLKAQGVDELVRAATDVAHGAIYVGPCFLNAALRQWAMGARRMTPLSTRESEVVALVAEGKTSKEISKSLGISVRTVDAHRSSLMKKLNIRDIAGLVRYAIRAGLVVA